VPELYIPNSGGLTLSFLTVNVSILGQFNLSGVTVFEPYGQTSTTLTSLYSAVAAQNLMQLDQWTTEAYQGAQPAEPYYSYSPLPASDFNAQAVDVISVLPANVSPIATPTPQLPATVPTLPPN
jgi:hypothetical protein